MHKHKERVKRTKEEIVLKRDTKRKREKKRGRSAISEYENQTGLKSIPLNYGQLCERRVASLVYRIITGL
jgi:hypothetical protein